MAWLAVERPIVKLYKSSYRLTKRASEIILCLLLMPILAFLFLVIAVFIHLDSPGPIFLTQKRIGKGGRVFSILKFRTRYYSFNGASHRAFVEAFINNKASLPNADEIEEKYFTRVGQFLHKTGLDDLPQLINVFKGEMSFVGPRPIVPREIEAYQTWHTERLAVLPGITGLAQVRGYRNQLLDEVAQYDIEYIEKQSPWLDLKILWWAITSVVFNEKK